MDHDEWMEWFTFILITAALVDEDPSFIERCKQIETEALGG